MSRILVAGDVMLDYYWHGDATRISPEAPVPVVKMNRQEPRLGGAANVALNLASLATNVTLCGIVGNDAAGSKLRSVASNFKINTELLWGETRTIEKIRILAQNQQIVRIDFEDPVTTDDRAAYDEIVRQQIPHCDALILSDYRKGALDDAAFLIETAKTEGKLVLVDPKGTDYNRYYGATVITPNRSELAQVVGSWNSEEDLIVKAQNLRLNLGLEKLLLTRSEEGMTLFGENEIVNFPTEAKEVFDVSGAGDTAIAVLAKCLCDGMDWHASVRTANRAAGIVVGRLGTASITLDDLKSLKN